jgi:hypothetical protein
MTINKTIDALCLLTKSVFYAETEERRTTVFSSQRLKDTLEEIIGRSGYSPDAMIETMFENSKCKTYVLLIDRLRTPLTMLNQHFVCFTCI